MNAALLKLASQRGKNLTLLVVCGTAVALVHGDAAGAIIAALCVAVGAPAVAEKWSPQANGGDGGVVSTTGEQ